MIEVQPKGCINELKFGYPEVVRNGYIEAEIKYSSEVRT